MICRHCGVAFHDNPTTTKIGNDVDSPFGWSLIAHPCPTCGRLNFELSGLSINPAGVAEGTAVAKQITFFVWPRGAPGRALSSEVPSQIAADYREAAEVLPISPKASAALSRRLLQRLLRDSGGYEQRDLSQQIQAAIDGGDLPRQLRQDIDAIRNIGNFGAHPIKSTTSGEIVDVVAGEAEWTLDVLSALFEHYFVQPARAQERRAALNSKLTDAGKPAIKGDGTPPGTPYQSEGRR